MKQQYELTAEETARAKSLKQRDEIKAFWVEMGKKYNFDPTNFQFIKGKVGTTAKIEAEPIVEEVTATEEPHQEASLSTSEPQKHDYNAFGEQYAIVVAGDAKADVFAKIAGWKKQYSDLSIKDEKDKVGYDQVSAAISLVKSTRTSVEATRKKLKSEPLELGRSIDSLAAQITTQLTELEEGLKAKKQVIDDIKEKQKADKLAELEKVYNDRVMQITNLGMVFNGSRYQLNSKFITTADIKAWTNGAWGLFIDEVTKEWSEEQTRKQEAEQKVKDEQLRADQAKKVGERKTLLTSLGFVEDDGKYIRPFQSKKAVDETRAHGQIMGFAAIEIGGEEFDREVAIARVDTANAQNEIREAQEKIKAEQERQEAELRRLEEQKAKQEEEKRKQRMAFLNGLGYLFNGIDFVRNVGAASHVINGVTLEFTEKSWAKIIAEATEESKKLDDAAKAQQEENERIRIRVAEQQRLEKLESERNEAARLEALKPDKDKLYSFATSLETLHAPNCQDIKANVIVANALEKIKEAVDLIRKQTEQL